MGETIHVWCRIYVEALYFFHFQLNMIELEAQEETALANDF